MERELTEFFALPTRIGRVIPLSWDERQLHDVEIFLPAPAGAAQSRPADGADPARLDPENRVAYCRRAHWLRSAAGEGHDLLLSEGAVDLRPGRWAPADWRRLEHSLRHDYPQLRLNKVGIERSAIRWACDGSSIAIDLGAAEGVVWFETRAGREEGVARLSAGMLNGQPASVVVQAKFDPLGSGGDAGARAPEDGLVHEFELTAPPDRPIPLAQFQLDRLFGGPVTQGQFCGRLSYRARAGGGSPEQVHHVFTITDGELKGLQLGQLARNLPGGPLAGQLDLKLKQLRIEQERGARTPFMVTRLQFSGQLTGLDLSAAMAAAGLPPCRGAVFVEVHEADLEPGRPLRLLRATGRAENLDLAQLSGLLGERVGQGRIHGAARVGSFSLVVEDGRLVALEGELFGDPWAGRAAGGADGNAPAGLAQAVDVKLLEALAPIISKLKGLAGDLPEAIPYQSLKVHAFNIGDKLVLQGLGGTDERSIMTLQVPLPGWARTLGAPEATAVDVPSPGPNKPIDLAALAARLARPLAPIPVRGVSQKIRQTLHR